MQRSSTGHTGDKMLTPEIDIAKARIIQYNECVLEVTFENTNVKLKSIFNKELIKVGNFFKGATNRA